MTKVVTSTGQAPLDLTQYGVMVGRGAGQATSNTTIVLTDGQFVMGNTSSAPTAGVITNGAGISVAFTGGNWEITNTAIGGLTVVHETSSSVTLDPATMYVMDKSTLITATLPATASIGDQFVIVGQGSGLWQVNCTTGQTIHAGSIDSTADTGSIAASNQYDCVTLVCTADNTDFVCYGMQGALTVV